VTLKKQLNRDLDIVKPYIRTKMKLLGKAIRKVWRELEKYENSSQGQSSRSNVTNFQSLLAFTMGRMTTELHRFLIGSFQDFLRTDTDVQTSLKTVPVVALLARR